MVSQFFSWFVIFISFPFIIVLSFFHCFFSLFFFYILSLEISSVRSEDSQMQRAFLHLFHADMYITIVQGAPGDTSSSEFFESSGPRQKWNWANRDVRGTVGKAAASLVVHCRGLIVYDRNYLGQFSNRGPPAWPSKWKWLKFLPVFQKPVSGEAFSRLGGNYLHCLWYIFLFTVKATTRGQEQRQKNKAR